jgi:peptide deformylase
MYTIVVTPNPILIKKTQKVTKFDKKLNDILRQMEETLKSTTDPVGVGLAAPQVGLPLSIFQMKPTDSSPVKHFINPVIVQKPIMSDDISAINRKEESVKKQRKGKLLEGCLSIPNIWGHVTRDKNLTLEWQDEKGRKHKKYFTGFPAVIIQHEMDHLQGILFTKHVVEQKEKLYKSHKNDKGEDEFDEVKL